VCQHLSSFQKVSALGTCPSIADHCIVCPMFPVSMNCPFCCFLRFICINYTSEWVIADYRHISNLNYTIAKTSYIRSDGIDVHFVYYINTISRFFRHVAPIGHTIQWSKKNKTQKTEKKSNRDPTKTQVWYKVLSVILERKKNIFHNSYTCTLY
jgi:hypothetical protein